MDMELAKMEEEKKKISKTSEKGKKERS